MPSITSANAKFVLSVANFLPIPQTLKGYASDTAFTGDDVTTKEVQKGVDGIISAGWLPQLHVQTIELQADSPSLLLFEQWWQAENSQQESYWASGTILVSSIGKLYTMNNGVLSRIKSMPGAQKVLQPFAYQITWGDVIVSPV
ncbi:hypothetical protein PCO31110_01596 [Pandoraea communis]|uniref:Uncharacterized protein n=1 Tax=Pandoraea communis TaxID=2508297 RepID=A0A5E4TRG6_9BURK|nr:hypothetical protein [Pandoraea communis]VVD90530.1 hypothetical protein PCO31110_01596 [Pandoraea communis]